MSRKNGLALLGAAALLAAAAAPALAQSESPSMDPAMDMSGLSVEVTGVEYAYTNLPTSLPVGSELTFTNDGAELHELVLVRIADDVTESVEELLAMAAEGRDPMTEGLVEMVGAGPLIAMPGETAEGSLVLESEGRYVAICFVPQGMSPERLEEAGLTLEMLGPEADPSAMPAEAVALFEELSANPPHMALGMVQEFAVTAADSSPGPLPEAGDAAASEAPSE
jgi:hypothetical protein